MLELQLVNLRAFVCPGPGTSSLRPAGRQAPLPPRPGLSPAFIPPPLWDWGWGWEARPALGKLPDLPDTRSSFTGCGCVSRCDSPEGPVAGPGRSQAELCFQLSKHEAPAGQPGGDGGVGLEAGGTGLREGPTHFPAGALASPAVSQICCLFGFRKCQRGPLWGDPQGCRGRG